MKLLEAKKANPRAILVRSGVLFDVFAPKEEDIDINDIAHALSNLCRYGGHSPKFYSVAQHSVLCSLKGKNLQEQLELLMHDASEAYLIDLPKPIKMQIPQYIEIEDNLLAIIFKKFNLTFPLTDRVHKVDYELLEYEYERFHVNQKLEFTYWSPEEAKAKFLARYYELTRQIKEQNAKPNKKN